MNFKSIISLLFHFKDWLRRGDRRAGAYMFPPSPNANQPWRRRRKWRKRRKLWTIREVDRPKVNPEIIAKHERKFECLHFGSCRASEIFRIAKLQVETKAETNAGKIRFQSFSVECSGLKIDTLCISCFAFLIWSVDNQHIRYVNCWLKSKAHLELLW